MTAINLGTARTAKMSPTDADIASLPGHQILAAAEKKILRPGEEKQQNNCLLGLVSSQETQY